MKVPIKNLYFLLLYAWDYLDLGSTVDIGALKAAHPVDLFAYVLIQLLDRALKQGLDRGYVEELVTTARPVGRFEFAASVHQNAFAQNKICCVQDRFDHDVLLNRIIKTTIRVISETKDLDKGLRLGLLGIYDRLDGIREVRLYPGIFEKVQVHRNNRKYAVILGLCEIVLNGLIVDEHGLGRRILGFEKDEVRMRMLFQKFVTNLLRRRLKKHFRVSARRIPWQLLVANPNVLGFVPTLNMDIVVEDDQSALVIDTKYTANCLSETFSTQRFRSEHMYQIYSYVSNYAEFSPMKKVSGLILYPSVEASMQMKFSIMGHDISVSTVSLDAEWQSIESELMRLCLPLNAGIGE